MGGNSYVDRQGASSSATAVKKQGGGGGGGNDPMTLAGYAMAGVGAMVLIQSAVTLARVGMKSGGDKVVDAGKNFASPSSSSFPPSPFSAFATGVRGGGGGGSPWHESLARYWQIGEDLGWDAECIVGEICADMAPQEEEGQEAKGIVKGTLQKA